MTRGGAGAGTTSGATGLTCETMNWLTWGGADKACGRHERDVRRATRRHWLHVEELGQPLLGKVGLQAAVRPPAHGTWREEAPSARSAGCPPRHPATGVRPS